MIISPSPSTLVRDLADRSLFSTTGWNTLFIKLGTHVYSLGLSKSSANGHPFPSGTVDMEVQKIMDATVLDFYGTLEI